MSKHDEYCERNGPEQMFCGCEDRKELNRLRTENAVLRAIAEKSIETIEWQRREKEVLREFVREALYPASHDWRRNWNERAEKALTPPT